MANTYKIFISHSWTYVGDLEQLKKLLDSRGYFNVVYQEATPDTPINSENATYIKFRLRHMIAESHAVLAIAGVYATHSEWMNWELQTAKELKKPIIGVIPWGQQRVSSMVTQNATEIVGWNTESIVAAIRIHAQRAK